MSIIGHPGPVRGTPGVAPGVPSMTPAARVIGAIRSRIAGSAFTLPAWLLMLGVVALPLATAIYLSFTSESLASTDPAAFVGLRNYTTAVFTPTFVRALRVTLTIVAIGLVIQLPIGFLLARILNRELFGHRIVRSALLIPMLLTPVAVGLMWRFMFNPDLGLARYLLAQVHPGLNWLGDPTLAMAVIVFVDSWMHIPFVMIMMLAGLAGLPGEVLEAASIDGAKWWRMTRYIILPLLQPVILVTLLIRFIDSFRLFDIVYAITNGGPGDATTNVSILAYLQTFTFFQIAQGAALSVAIALLIFPVYFVFLRVTRV